MTTYNGKKKKKRKEWHPVEHDNNNNTHKKKQNRKGLTKISNKKIPRELVGRSNMALDLGNQNSDVMWNDVQSDGRVANPSLLHLCPFTTLKKIRKKIKKKKTALGHSPVHTRIVLEFFYCTFKVTFHVSKGWKFYYYVILVGLDSKLFN